MHLCDEHTSIARRHGTTNDDSACSVSDIECAALARWLLLPVCTLNC